MNIRILQPKEAEEHRKCLLKTLAEVLSVTYSIETAHKEAVNQYMSTVSYLSPFYFSLFFSLSLHLLSSTSGLQRERLQRPSHRSRQLSSPPTSTTLASIIDRQIVPPYLSYLSPTSPIVVVYTDFHLLLHTRVAFSGFICSHFDLFP